MIFKFFIFPEIPFNDIFISRKQTLLLDLGYRTLTSQYESSIIITDRKSILNIIIIIIFNCNKQLMDNKNRNVEEEAKNKQFQNL
jgi:hypothetical protein